MAREPVFRGKRKESESKGEVPVAPRSGIDGTAGVAQPQNLEDARYDDELRPKLLTDVVGQQKVITRLKITLDAAKMRNEPLGHLLLDGPPGLGKTTLATVIPASWEPICKSPPARRSPPPRICSPISRTPPTAPCSSSTKSTVFLQPSKNISTQPWRTSGSISRWATG